jgi:N-acyl-D-amino-acid deacylase
MDAGDLAMLDIVIRNASLVDGTGAPVRQADIGIKDGLIAEVGRIDTPARASIDAAGRIMTPGFVDIHTHYDGQASWDPFLAPTSLNGVTSIAMGNCGVGFAPARPDRHAWLIALLEGVEDIPGTALAEGLTWDWESFPDYLDALGRRRFALDVAAHLPHAALRTYVMGDRGGDHREHPTATEIAEMARLTEQALAAGALGFTTSRTFVHRSRTGENIGTLEAGEAELLGIAAAMRRAGRGVIQLISDAYLTADDAFAERELDLIEAMARTSGRPLSFTVQQTDEAPDRYRHIFSRVAGMVAAGLDVKCQVAPRPIGVIQGLEATLNPFLFCPEWRRIGSLPLAQKVAELQNPTVRATLLAQHAQTFPEGFGTQIAHGFDRMFRVSDPVDYEPAADKSIAAEARSAGVSPASYMLDLLCEAEGRRLLYMPLINYARGSLSDCHAMMTAPNTLYGLSDGGAHCGTICDASFPTSTLAIWVKGNRAGSRIPLEELVHGLTQRNAAHVGWTDRGVVAPGLRADLNLLDMESLAVPPPELIHDLPAGGGRLVQRPRGIALTICAGRVTFRDGEATGELPGRLIRA